MNLTPKQEAFVKAFLETGNGTQAYRTAYDAENMKDSTVRAKACELLKNGNIRERLERARESSQKRHDITIAKLTDMLIEDRELARKVESPAAAVSAVLAIGKLHGLIVDKKEVTRKRDAADFDDDELAEIARMGREAQSKANGAVH